MAKSRNETHESDGYASPEALEVAATIRNFFILGVVVAVLARYFLVIPPLASWVIGMSSATFLLMGVDKTRAQERQFRVAEIYIFLFALLGGSPGLVLAISLFRHKTRQGAFLLVTGAIVLLHIVSYFRFFGR